MQIILYLFHTLTIPLCYPLPAGLTAPFTYTIPYFSKKRNSFHSHLTIFNIFLFLHAVFPNQKLVCYILFIVGQWGTAGTAGTALFSFSSPYVRGRVIVFCWTCCPSSVFQCSPQSGNFIRISLIYNPSACFYSSYSWADRLISCCPQLQR